MTDIDLMDVDFQQGGHWLDPRTPARIAKRQEIRDRNRAKWLAQQKADQAELAKRKQAQAVRARALAALGK